MLVVALVISTQTARIRAQAANAIDREARTKALYRLSRGCRRSPADHAARTAAEPGRGGVETPVVIFLLTKARSHSGGAPPISCWFRAQKRPPRSGFSITAQGGEADGCVSEEAAYIP
jgi:K+-sensing histidine kinase KdpD